MDGQQVGVDVVRRRFPWVGLASVDEAELSARYREMLAGARKDREIVAAIEAVQRSV